MEVGNAHFKESHMTIDICPSLVPQQWVGLYSYFAYMQGVDLKEYRRFDKY